MRVHVTGRTYQLERIEPGATTSIHLQPTSESHIEVTINGYSDPLVLDTYIEPGYGGYLSAEINPEGVQVLENRIAISLCEAPRQNAPNLTLAADAARVLPHLGSGTILRRGQRS